MRLKKILSGAIAILLMINLGGCNNMIEIQSANNVIAGAIPNEITADLMADWFNTKADENDCKLSVPLMMLAELFLEEGAIEGIRGDIAFCQSIKETGWFRYGGQVLPEQNNFAGIGATNNSPVGKGAWFKTARDGVRAQIQHLKAYANDEALVNPCIDPRFGLVTRGAAGNKWTGLNGRWAVPGDGYGESILALWEEMYNYCVENSMPSDWEEDEDEPSDWAEESWQWAQDSGITDGSNPKGNITREQAAVMFERLFDLQRRDMIFAHLEAVKSLLSAEESLEDFI